MEEGFPFGHPEALQSRYCRPWEGTARPQDYRENFSSSSLELLLNNWEDVRVLHRHRHRGLSERATVFKRDSHIHDKRDIADLSDDFGLAQVPRCCSERLLSTDNGSPLPKTVFDAGNHPVVALYAGPPITPPTISHASPSPSVDCHPRSVGVGTELQGVDELARLKCSLVQ
ncbi:hypothetical protein J6590_091124 [Homalodisca vitripennis]|nr:hypothetical protein J6590_091124 [Homalodisca vitripennis]